VATGLTSTSLSRAPGPSKTFVRGKSGYVPFWPGGLDGEDAALAESRVKVGGMGWQTVPPGLTRGLRLLGDDPVDQTLEDLNDVAHTRSSLEPELVGPPGPDDVGCY
jgi:antiviral helicase SKI2